MKMLIDIDVPDLTQAIAFYREALGLQLNRMLDDDVAELVGGSSVIYLMQKPPESKPTGTAPDRRRYARHWTPVHIDFVVDDLEAAMERVLAAGAVRESDPVAWRGSTCVTFSDPFGHGFCLIQFEHVTYR